MAQEAHRIWVTHLRSTQLGFEVKSSRNHTQPPYYFASRCLISLLLLRYSCHYSFLLLYQIYIYLVSCLKQLSQVVCVFLPVPKDVCLVCYRHGDAASSPWTVTHWLPTSSCSLVPHVCGSTLDVAGAWTRVRHGHVSSVLWGLSERKMRQCTCSSCVVVCWAAHQWEEGRPIEAEKLEGLWRDLIRRRCVSFQVLYWSLR